MYRNPRIVSHRANDTPGPGVYDVRKALDEERASKGGAQGEGDAHLDNAVQPEQPVFRNRGSQQDANAAGKVIKKNGNQTGQIAAANARKVANIIIVNKTQAKLRELQGLNLSCQLKKH